MKPLAAFALLVAGCGGDTPAPDAATPDTGVPDDLFLHSDAGVPPDATVTGGDAAPPASGSVLEHHNGPTRSGLYVVPGLTRAAAAKLHRDGAFKALLDGPTYAQPLYLADAHGGKGLVFAFTEQNHVYAFDPTSGATVWQKTYGSPVPRAMLPCGNIDPLGITGTPVIDPTGGPAGRTLFFDAMTLSGGAPHHVVHAVSVEDGGERAGWPVDVAASLKASPAFDAPVQNQRGALLLLGSTLYVPYGGHYGDCGDYHGRVVGFPLQNPGSPAGWSTRAAAGGIWAPGGLASDGVSVYASTGNSFGAGTYGDGESVVRLQPGPVSSGKSDDFFAPLNWKDLDNGDVDLGGSGPLLVHVAGATPPDLVVALGKDGKAYLIDRVHMGGVSAGVAQKAVATNVIITAAASYATAAGTYVAMHTDGLGCPKNTSGDLVAVRIAAAAPPTLSVAWCAAENGRGSPMVTATGAGGEEAIVWTVGAEEQERLLGFHGDTGAVVFAGGGPDEQLGMVRRFETPIVAAHHIYVAGDAELYAFTW